MKRHTIFTQQCGRFLIGGACLVLSLAAQAGPPLISDDAQALGGAGKAELIVAATGFWRPGMRQVDGPVVDVTAGLSPTVDATLVVSVSRLRGKGGDDNAALLCPGIKWQLLGGGGFNISVSPALMLDINDADAGAVLLPVQAEWVTGNWVLGVDAGHIATRRGRDQWQAGRQLCHLDAYGIADDPGRTLGHQRRAGCSRSRLFNRRGHRPANVATFAGRLGQGLSFGQPAADRRLCLPGVDDRVR